MKKILFNDKFGLTQAVLDGRKTQTRRIITCPKEFKGEWVAGFYVYVYTRQSDGATISCPCMYDADERTFDGGEILPKYKLGEVVAVAQSYKDAGIEPTHRIMQRIKGFKLFPSYANVEVQYAAGWNNKLFVDPYMMPHRIHITNVRVERLNDISDSDCKAEGIDYVNGYSESYFFGFGVKTDKGWIRLGNTPREAYAALIDRISGKCVWQSNPFVFVYDFELVKD